MGERPTDILGMRGERVLHVSYDIVDFFEGWLEFAGQDLPGVAYCPDWPREFTIREMPVTAGHCWARDSAGIRHWIENAHYKTFLVRSPEWDGQPSTCWTPTFYKRYENTQTDSLDTND
jgi:hypothetical protein